MPVGQNSTELVVRPKHEIATCSAPVKPGERLLLSNIAKRMLDRGVHCFLQEHDGNVSLIAAA